jgi:hypothetical protein
MNTKARDEERIDETLEESFPASDPPANTVETGIALDVESELPDDADDANRPAGSAAAVERSKDRS